MQWQDKRIAKGEMYRWSVGEESDGRKEGRRSWRAVRKLAEVGLLTARKSVSVPEPGTLVWCGGIGGSCAFSRTLSRIVLFCPALVALWVQAGATQIGRVGRYRRVLECQSPRPAQRWLSLAAATFSRRAG